jgi:GT2 family glycosyltransferase
VTVDGESDAPAATSLDAVGLLGFVDAVETVLGDPFAVDPLLPFYGQDASGDDRNYEAYVERHRPDAAALTELTAKLLHRPLFSVVIPVYKPELRFFVRCVESVRRQIYPHWELCLGDDGSGDPQLDALFAELAAADSRIKVTQLPVNGGISAATNAAIALASGDYIAFMDHDDELTIDALAEVAITLGQEPTADVLYTDEDKIDEENRRYAPYFKPGWSPDYLLTCAYTGHLSVVRRRLVDEVGGLRTEFDGSQDHDLMMRVTERAARIVHVPKILYHWRAIAGSAAGSSEAKPWAHAAGYEAVRDTLVRRGEEGEVLPGAFAGARRIKRAIAGSPLVSIIIPFRDGGALLDQCIRSIDEKAGYDRRELVLVDNGSWEPETLALVAALEERDDTRVIRDPSPFNWSRLNNTAAHDAEGDLLLFLNNDIEARNDGWLAAMVEHGQRPEVGAVGARLVYPNGCVQHAGLIIGMGGIAGHAFRYCPPPYPAYFGMAMVVRNYSAITGACMLVRRQIFEELGGFDDDLAVAYNDVDFCLRLRDSGYLITYTPYAELVHHESLTRGLGSDGDEDAAVLDRWRKVFEAGDPYFNPNLSLLHSEFRLVEPGEEAPWRRRLRDQAL